LPFTGASFIACPSTGKPTVPAHQAPDRAAGEPAAASPAADAGRRPAPLPRQEIEALLRELRGMIDGMVRVIDAERSLDHPDEP
jgi:hypothetical protein